jgi:uncharacterized protein YbaR (Trm112 family)
MRAPVGNAGVRLRGLRIVAADLAAILREVAHGHREARTHVPSPPSSGLVLEIGAGQAAHGSAHLVIDKYVADNFERPGEADLDVSKPLVVADGQALPLADGSFSYAIALHVLEHAPRPDLFADELSRVADAGFVQVPTREAELTFGWPYHPWLIDREGDKLVFSPRNGRAAPLGELFHGEYARSALMRNWWAATRSRWHHSVEWRGRLDVEVHGTSAAEQTAEFDTERTLAALRALRDSRGIARLPDRVREALRCPVCRGRLELGADAAACVECGRRYPLVAEVPVLLSDAAA